MWFPYLGDYMVVVGLSASLDSCVYSLFLFFCLKDYLFVWTTAPLFELLLACLCDH